MCQSIGEGKMVGEGWVHFNLLHFYGLANYKSIMQEKLNSGLAVFKLMDLSTK